MISDRDEGVRRFHQEGRVGDNMIQGFGETADISIKALTTTGRSTI